MKKTCPTVYHFHRRVFGRQKSHQEDMKEVVELPALKNFVANRTDKARGFVAMG